MKQKRFEVITDSAMDLTWYIWYDTKNEICGLNFYHGEYDEDNDMAPDDMFMIIFDNLRNYRVPPEDLFKVAYETFLLTFDNRRCSN